MAVSEANTSNKWLFECSDWQDDSMDLINFLWMLQSTNARMVGFNNLGFDYPVVHHFQNTMYSMDNIAYQLWEKASAIINSTDRGFGHIIWKPEITQIDLYKIHHFDNAARATSLKMLEFNMRRDSIEDLPFKPNTYLTEQQAPVLREYNWEDLDATEHFYNESLELIEFREQLSREYRHDFMNYNDTKIGKQFFIMQLERHKPGCCYYYDDNDERQMRQTHRDAIPLRDVIFPYITFTHPEFQRVHQHLLNQVVYDANAIKDVSATIDGFRFDFGRGGIHGSINDAIVVGEPDVVVLDLDVTSYYPSLAIVNRLYPEHLGETFCDIYADIKAQRTQHAKGTAQNKMLKLALNGVYGDTGNHYSPFFDMKYLLSITINGQLLLCMLAEHLTYITGLDLIQINTDGLTVRVPRDQLPAVKQVTDWWQAYTQLDLEDVEYSRMFIRDVNNYIGEDLDGKLKRKGAYETLPPGERNPSGWHQNLSAMAVPMAAEAYLVRGTPIDQFIYHHPNVMDFMLRTKVDRNSRVEIDGVEYQRITRYLITKTGGTMVKVSPPPDGYVDGQWKRANGLTDQFYRQVRSELDPVGELDSTGKPWDERINTKNKSKYGIRRTGIDVGWLVTPYNQIDTGIDRDNINYDYYIQAARKLTDQLKVMR